MILLQLTSISGSGSRSMMKMGCQVDLVRTMHFHVILSSLFPPCSYFELESSGVREEIRYHYRFKGKPRSESFPYRLADGQWHKIAITISTSHLLLHVDCNR
ncbi:Protein kinase C-binding protein nell1 [Goodea atripinnis]|uniref:Protein kinase C-binding protein nell1 n=1 Tax=Goodea atripinnis TaxID=208336 RepID=A0ABV0NND1_9TELE